MGRVHDKMTSNLLNGNLSLIFQEASIQDADPPVDGQPKASIAAEAAAPAAEETNTQLAAPEDPLPQGWQAVVDQASGNTYYEDLTTGETTWVHPLKDVPEGWSADIDPSSGLIYYIDNATGLSSWTKPGAQQPLPL